MIEPAPSLENANQKLCSRTGVGDHFVRHEKTEVLPIMGQAETGKGPYQGKEKEQSYTWKEAFGGGSCPVLL